MAKRHKGKELILCEGYMDVISLHQAGFTNAVASLGTALTDGHAGILRRYTHIKMLRKDLGPYADHIVTVRGMGYKFEV